MTTPHTPETLTRDDVTDRVAEWAAEIEAHSVLERNPLYAALYERRAKKLRNLLAAITAERARERDNKLLFLEVAGLLTVLAQGYRPENLSKQACDLLEKVGAAL